MPVADALEHAMGVVGEVVAPRQRADELPGMVRIQARDLVARSDEARGDPRVARRLAELLDPGAPRGDRGLALGCAERGLVPAFAETAVRDARQRVGRASAQRIVG